MPEDKNALPTRTSADYAHTIAKAALSAIPVIGGTAAEIFALVIAPPLELRRDEWLEELYCALKSLEEREDGFKIENLSQDERFISATLRATQIALRTHQNEKRNALRNALLNVVCDKTLDEETETFFLGLVEDFTLTHIEAMRLLSDKQTFPENRRIRLQQEHVFTNVIVLDLNLRGLLIDPRPYVARNRDSSEPLITAGWLLSPLGTKFLKFISAPA
jgi:hypothetical protein